ncbi:MAG TPA: glycoside hydrolase family 5 protein [Vitreimonas sp.]|uniref:glycoside hydrolase family 5 protein n=1 Tax=Vitreimonas sp. TaxID=3069702 RepID=UPI002D7521D9|nr:glycoside hydrolase family 5 protein [Vitreimonas sp.]HYD86079.1 glycoside hydrolase family 5 protein [Vitreimonas sp.]
MRLSRRALLLAAAALPSAAAAQPQPPMITGVNLAGLEFNSGRLPGRLDHDFVSPSAAELDYYRDAGANAVRIPFRWERAQPELGGELNEDYLGLLDRLVEESGRRQMRVVLDPHQYGRRIIRGEAVIIGESAVTAAHFAGFWGALAQRYRRASHVIFGLQNEPHDQDTNVLLGVLNAAMTAIRAAGARQLILAPGNGWSGAHAWLRRGNQAMLGLRDPIGNMALDVHQFLDADSSGTHAACPARAGNRLERFTAWARENRQKAFLSEFGAGADESCARELTALLDHMAANRDVWIGWTYWAGGPWWDEDYPLSIAPLSIRNPEHRPQMRILQRYFQ